MLYQALKRACAQVALASLVLLVGARLARGDDCIALGGAIDAERRACLVSGEVWAEDSAVPDGVFNLDESLIVEDGATITVPPLAGGNRLTVRIAGDFVVRAGGNILGNASGTGVLGGIGATLHITASGNMALEGDGTAGAVVSSSHDSQACTSAGAQAGDVTLEAGGDFVAGPGSIVGVTSTLCKGGNILVAADGGIRIDGLIASGPSMTVLPEKHMEKVLSGGSRSAGRIDIRSMSTQRPGVVVGAAGVVVSQALNVSGGIVLEGCGVEINGLLASLAADRSPDRSNIVLRSTDRISVNGDDLGRDGSRQGRIRADGLLADPGGPGERYRIDLFARKDIAVTGPTSGPVFAVTSNPRRTTMSPPSGIIRVISIDGGISATGNVFQAGRDAPAKTGGALLLEAAGAIDLTGATIAAVGDFSPSGVLGAGGTIAVRSFRDRVRWQGGLGDVRPTGTGIATPNRGVISLTGCLQVDVEGSGFPHTPPEGTPTSPVLISGDCPPDAAPLLPPAAEFLPACECVVASECNDGDPCNGAETCDAQNSRCVAGTPLKCDDGNVCTDDACAPATGCVSTNNAAACDDGNACTTNDTCAGGLCVSGPSAPCDDANVCNGVETCDPRLGCRPGTPVVCDDGDICNGTETCDPQAGCYLAGCDPESEACSPPMLADGSACGDGDACNGEEVCQGAVCTAPSPEVALACANASLRLFVSNFDDGTVTVLNAPDVPIVSVGQGPWGVGVHPLGSEVYVTNREENTVSVIDTATLTVEATIPVGNLPLGVAVDPAGAVVYVANYNDDTITLIDVNTHDVIGSMPGGPGPAGLAFNPSGTRLYVTDFASDVVSVFDTSTRRRSATVQVGQQPLGIAVDVVRNRAYVANFASDDVSVLGLSSDTVLTTVPVGSRPFGVSVFGPLGVVYITNAGANTISVMDTTMHRVIDTLTVGSGPLGVEFDVTGTRAYVVNGGDGTVSAVDSSSQAVMMAVPVGTLPVAFGRFAATTRDGCGAPSPVCDDRDPFTLDSCSSFTGCIFTPLHGLAAARAGIDALGTAADSAPAGALGSDRQSRRLRKQLAAAGRRLRAIERAEPVTVGSKRAVSKRQRRVRRTVGRVVGLIERGIRRGTMQRDIGWRLLDLARTTLVALGKVQRSAGSATRAAPVRLLSTPPPPVGRTASDR